MSTNFYVCVLLVVHGDVSAWEYKFVICQKISHALFRPLLKKTRSVQWYSTILLFRFLHKRDIYYCVYQVLEGVQQNGLKIRRLAGDQFEYSQLCQELLAGFLWATAWLLTIHFYHLCKFYTLFVTTTTCQWLSGSTGNFFRKSLGFFANRFFFTKPFWCLLKSVSKVNLESLEVRDKAS